VSLHSLFLICLGILRFSEKLLHFLLEASLAELRCFWILVVLDFLDERKI